ncbi:MAG: molybdopterin-synthase adenylyltransferase MoeB [Chloroflexota bacterium]|nr:MAG: molybdenum cofactor biosynthesis protein MoeB [Bellilinea sp.]
MAGKSELTQEEILRYSRHLLIPEVGLEGQRKLKAASVLLVGSGGLGSPIALYLAAAGVGRIGVVDYDVVDASNLQRQIIHDTQRIGMLKVESARSRLLALNPFVQVDVYNEVFTSQNAERIAADYDILVDGSDNFPTRYLLNDLAVLSGKPFVYGSIFRFEGQVSVFDARHGPCYRCLFPEPPPPDTVPSCADAGVFGVLPGTVGSIQATEVIKLILGIGEPLIGKLLLYDALDMNIQLIYLRKNPQCKVCGETPEITHLIDYEAFCGVPARTVQDTGLEGNRIIEPVELKQRLERGDEVVLIDVRDPVEQQVAALPGALVIPLERLGQRMKELDPQREYVLFCRTGVRSARGVRQMMAAGFTKVKNLRGGLNAWAEKVDPTMLKY